MNRQRVTDDHPVSLATRHIHPTDTDAILVRPGPDTGMSPQEIAIRLPREPVLVSYRPPAHVHEPLRRSRFCN